jgi:hypothetical protein
MQHSAIRPKNELMTVFTHTDSSPIILDVYQLDNLNNFTQLLSPSIVNVVDDFYKATFTTPNQDIWLCLIFGEEPIVIRNGSPNNRFIYYTGFSGQSLNYKRINTSGTTIQSGTLSEMLTIGSPGNGPGYYYFTPSDDNLSIIQVDDGEPFPYKIPYQGERAGTDLFGEIQIESGKWQLIAIPVRFGYWDDSVSPGQLVHDGTTVAKINEYVIKQLEDKYGTGVVSSANTYHGDVDAFYNFIPGTTNPASPHNFQLTYMDSSRPEVSGFWIKSEHTSDMILEWGEF